MGKKLAPSRKAQAFIGKYEETNPISRALVKGFYSALENLIPPDAKTILEVGCGAGFSSERIVGMLDGPIYEGSDVDEELVDIARSRLPGTTFSVESIYELKREDASFDLVVALETLEHLNEPLKALEELARVAKKHLILSVPREPLWRLLNITRLKYVSAFGNTPGHLNHWSKKGFVRFLNENLEVVQIRSPIPWTIVLARVDKS